MRVLVRLQTLHGCFFDKRHRFIVFSDVPHPQSQAGLILLKLQYLKMDIRQRGDNDWRIWLTFRNRYLRRQRKINGSLVCYICGKDKLIANFNSPYSIGGRGATVDHRVPLSKGGKKFNEENLEVCCDPCNSGKSDKSLEEFKQKKSKKTSREVS